MLCSKIKIKVVHDDFSSKSADHSYVTLGCLLRKLSHNQKLTSICCEQYYPDPFPAGGPRVTMSCKGYGLATLQIKKLCVYGDAWWAPPLSNLTFSQYICNGNY